MGLTQYSFGGSFASNKINLVTNERTCPLKYRPVRIANDIYVCFTEQIFDLDIIPKFGGMFSCQTKHSSASDTDACPTGFSAYVMGVIENDCILHVCLDLKTRDVRGLPPISLPPYSNLMEHINISMPITYNKNDSNATDENDPSIPTLHMSPKIIYKN